ncbi:hypothetical protein GCM10009610_02450 [Pseudonocardia xinjiangensis]
MLGAVGAVAVGPPLRMISRVTVEVGRSRRLAISAWARPSASPRVIYWRCKPQRRIRTAKSPVRMPRAIVVMICPARSSYVLPLFRAQLLIAGPSFPPASVRLVGVRTYAISRPFEPAARQRPVPG